MRISFVHGTDKPLFDVDLLLSCLVAGRVPVSESLCCLRSRPR